MAYDPNDPADVAIVTAAVNEALEAEREKHEADIEGLKNKNKELTDKLAKARKASGGESTAEIERLERDLEESQNKLSTVEGELRETKRKLTAAEKDRDTFKTTAETEGAAARSLVVDNGLTAALIDAKVAPQFSEAAKALLGKDVTVKDVDGKRQAFVGDKPLGEFVKEWAASDAGKPFVTAADNSGGGAGGGGSGSPGQKKLADMTETERSEMARTNPAGWQQLLKENNISIAA